MKRLILITLVLAVGVTVYSQSRRVVISDQLKNITAPYMQGINDIGPFQGFNPTVNSPLIEADIIGHTWYDSQSNGSMAKRAYVTDEGNMAAVWTRGMNTSGYPDRGTGYNYFDGTAWMAEPTARIESVRTGWPSIDIWNGGGEITVSHQSAGALVLSKRAVQGTGTWTESMISSPSGAPNPLWPSILTSGDSNQFVHILALTTPVASSGGALYNGLDGALLYYRSSDGGTTWEINGIQIPPLDSSEYTGFGADSYSWGNPKGDTIAFVVGDNWTDVFIMQSFDNGDTWTKVPILSNGNKKTQPNTLIEPFYSSDGSNSMAIDQNGVYHVVFGRMRASDPGDGRVYYPYTDGLVYWNSTMPMLADSLNLDTLDANGQLVGYVLENAAGDTINTIPFYGVTMSSFGNITVDDNNDVFVLWSGVVVDNPTPEGLNFRHIYTRGSNTQGETWSDFFDWNTDINDIFIEFTFPYMAKKTTTDALHMVAQSADVPGSAIIQPEDVAVHENNIIHSDIPKGVMVGTNDLQANAEKKISIFNFPNPFHNNTTISLVLPYTTSVKLEVTTITGQTIYSLDRGTLSAGTYQIPFSSRSLSPGVYFYTLRAGDASFTKRMIVR